MVIQHIVTKEHLIGIDQPIEVSDFLIESVGGIGNMVHHIGIYRRAEGGNQPFHIILIVTKQRGKKEPPTKGRAQA